MNIVTKLGIIAISLTFMAPAIGAKKDPNLKLIKARQSDMKIRSFSAGPLFGMAKGKIEYDAELASRLANNLLLLTQLDMGRAWAKGTDSVAYKGKTSALPKIWTTYPKIGKYGKKFVTAVKELSAVAGNGLDALKSKVGPLGKSCKGCHDEFREKRN